MVTVIDNMELLPPVLAADRAVVMVAVPWSPAHRRSLPVLEALESSQEQWSPGRPVGFFTLWPEKDAALHRWYEEICQLYHPRLALHGHGWAPFWWVGRGQVLDWQAKPYEAALESLQEKSMRAFRGSASQDQSEPQP